MANTGSGLPPSSASNNAPLGSIGSAPAPEAPPPDETRGSDRPTRAEMSDPGAHDRGGWLTLDEAAQQFRVERGELEHALRRGEMSGRRVPDEAIAPENAPADTVVPEGETAPDLGPRDEWLVQPDQVEHFLQARSHK
jgi:hypothetical protein